jgi:hypothetical protein
MEQVSHFMAQHGTEMNLNEIKRRLPEAGIAIGVNNVKVILESLVNRRHLSAKAVGQKILYKHQMPFLANDVKSLNVDNLV